MKKFNMFSSHSTSDEIIKAAKKHKEGDMFPEDGPFGFMYDQLNGPSMSFIVGSKKRWRFFTSTMRNFSCTSRRMNLSGSWRLIRTS